MAPAAKYVLRCPQKGCTAQVFTDKPPELCPVCANPLPPGCVERAILEPEEGDPPPPIGTPPAPAPAPSPIGDEPDPNAPPQRTRITRRHHE